MLPACEPLPVDPKQPQDALRAVQGPLPLGEFMRDAKGQAIEHLKRALRGDALAAEYALLALLSKAYVRTEVGRVLQQEAGGCGLARPRGGGHGREGGRQRKYG